MNPGEHLQLKNFRIAGINYRKNDMVARGSFAISNELYVQLLSNAAKHNISECFVVSTCNRTEIYGICQHMDQLVDLLFSVCNGDRKIFNETAYLKNGTEAVNHLYCVTSGLDSQILGDFEILGQVKNAYKMAKDAGRSGTLLDRIVSSAFQASKAVKTNTELSGGTVSVSFAAIQFMKQQYRELAGKKVVLIGTGKIGKTTCKNILNYTDCKDITLINRTEETASVLAKELGISYKPYSELNNEVNSADVVIVSTNAPTPIITPAMLLSVKEQLFIDLSVPCNIAPEVGHAATLIGVDELSRMNDETLEKRRQQVPAALAIIEQHRLEFMDWLHLRQYAPILKIAKNKLTEINTTKHPFAFYPTLCKQQSDEAIQSVINVMATKIKTKNAAGCHYIEAFNDYMAFHG